MGHRYGRGQEARVKDAPAEDPGKSFPEMITVKKKNFLSKCTQHYQWRILGSVTSEGYIQTFFLYSYVLSLRERERDTR